MDFRALFDIQCGLYVASVGTSDQVSGCITNTLMQQTHKPVKLSMTIEKSHLTHDLLMTKKSVGISVLSREVSTELIKRFGFVSGRDVEKFAGYSDFSMDANGNPLLEGPEISAVFSLSIYDMVDMGTHTLFLCNGDDSVKLDGVPITYWDYRERIKKS